MKMLFVGGAAALMLTAVALPASAQHGPPQVKMSAPPPTTAPDLEDRLKEASGNELTANEVNTRLADLTQLRKDEFQQRAANGGGLSRKQARDLGLRLEVLEKGLCEWWQDWDPRARKCKP